jgi:hypothetical protein
VIRLHIIVIHVNQDIATGYLGCEIPLLTNRGVVIHCDLLDLWKLTHQILDLIIPIVHDNPLQLIRRVGLAQEAVLSQSKKLAAIASDGQNADLREILFVGKQRLDILVRFKWKPCLYEAIDPCLMTCFLFLANELRSLGTILEGKLRVLAELGDQRVHRCIGKNSQTVGMGNRLGHLRKQGMGCEFTKRRDIRKNQVTSG